MRIFLLFISMLFLPMASFQHLHAMEIEGNKESSSVNRKVIKGKVRTRAGELFYRDSGGNGPAILCIHGNSTSSRLFKSLMKENPDLRFIAFDSPGHGQSFRASDENAEDVYSFPGCAIVILEALSELKVQKFSVLGISKGGHEAINLYAQATSQVESLILSGTPPLPHFSSQDHAGEVLGDAFKQTSAGALSGKEQEFSADEARLYMQANGLDPEDAKFIEAAQSTDGRARSFMFKTALANQRVDEVEVLKNANIPVLILGGQDDVFINYDYVRGLDLPAYVTVQVVENENHSFVWNNAKCFNALMRGHFAEQRNKESL